MATNAGKIIRTTTGCDGKKMITHLYVCACINLFSFLSSFGPWANGHIHFRYQRTAARISLNHSKTSDRKDPLQTSLTKHKMPKLVKFILPPSSLSKRRESGRGPCDSLPQHPPSLGLLFLQWIPCRYTGEGLRIWNYLVTGVDSRKDKSNYLVRKGQFKHYRPSAFSQVGPGEPISKKLQSHFWLRKGCCSYKDLNEIGHGHTDD